MQKVYAVYLQVSTPVKFAIEPPLPLPKQAKERTSAGWWIPE
jgi:hypothetical protein